MSAEPLSDDRAERLRRIASKERVAGADESFSGAVLIGADLREGVLRDLDLASADLTRANLAGASCRNIRLPGACLEDTDLSHADLTGADLSDVRAGQAVFGGALLEDARLARGMMRFARLEGAVLDGASLAGADLWAAELSQATAERADFSGARLDEAQCREGDFTDANFSGAVLRRADFARARLRRAVFRDTQFDGASFLEADLAGANLAFANLTSCDLTQIRLAGAWLERTRMRAAQLGGAVGEERERDYRGAYDAYSVLEINFRSLGNGDDESWAYRRRRRMGKLVHRDAFAACLHADTAWSKRLRRLWRHGGLYAVDCFVEWLSDYGESLLRVLRAFLVVLFAFAALYWLTGGLAPREDVPVSFHRGWAVHALDYLLFSLNSMTTVGTGEVELRAASELAVLLSSLETVTGTVIIGLFGFVLGARMRR